MTANPSFSRCSQRGTARCSRSCCPFTSAGQSGGADIRLEPGDVGQLAERVCDGTDRAVVPVTLEKDVEQRDEVFSQRLLVLLICLGETGAAELREEVERAETSFHVRDLVHLGLVVGVDELDRLGL